MQLTNPQGRSCATTLFFREFSSLAQLTHNCSRSGVSTQENTQTGITIPFDSDVELDELQPTATPTSRLMIADLGIKSAFRTGQCFVTAAFVVSWTLKLGVYDIQTTAFDL